MKEHVVIKIQKEHKKGDDTTKASRAGATPDTKPLRKLVNCTVENSSTEQAKGGLRLDGARLT